MTTLAPEIDARPVATGADRRKWIGLFVVLGGQFMTSLDTTVANIAAPNIGRDLHAGSGEVELAVVAYTVIYAAGLITGARIGNNHTYRGVFLTGLSLFTLASLGVGAAPNIEFLITMRALQGIGAATLIPQVVSLIQAMFIGRARTRALAAYGATISLGATAGLVFGGAVVNFNIFNWSWRPAFLVNVPVGVIVLIATRLLVPSVKGRGARLDLVGFCLLSLGAVLVMVPLALGRELRWPLWCVLSAIIGVLVLVIFVKLESEIGKRGGSPVLDLATFRSRNVRPGLVALILSGNTYMGLLFCMTVYLQDTRHESPLIAGAIFVPYGLGFGVMSAVGARFAAHHQHRFIAGGLVVMAASLFGLAALSRGGMPSLFPLEVLFLVAGLGYGAAFSTLLGLIAAHIDPVHIPDVSGLSITTNQFSFALGVACYGGIYFASGSLSLALVVMAIFALAAAPFASVLSSRANNEH